LIACLDARCRHPFLSFDCHRRPACTAGKSSSVVAESLFVKHQLRILNRSRSRAPSRILHFNVTAHPTAEWTGQQLREAFPFTQLPHYLLRDRDAIFGDEFREQVRDMGICEGLSARARHGSAPMSSE